MASITIQGKVLKPDGSGVGGGSIEVTLQGVGSKTGATEDVVGGTFRTPIAADGTVAFSLESNSAGLAGTKYLAAFRLPDGTRFVKEWTVADSPSPQDIGDLT